MHHCRILNKQLATLYLLFLFSLTPLPLFAATIPAALEQQEEDADADNDFDTNDNSVPPIEIGPAGNIKKESSYRTQAEQQLPVHFHVMWESRYVTQGRDNLSDNSLTSIFTDMSYDNFTFAPWVASSSYTDYRELNLNLVYGFEIDELTELYVFYTHLRSDTSDKDTSDNEVGIELGYTGFKYIQVSANWYYSFESEGSYLELALRHENTIGKNLTLSSSLITGLNDGYIVDGHSGLDHILARINLAYHPWEQLEVFSYLSHSQSIHRDALKYTADTDLGDYTWGGIGATYRF